MSRSSTAVLLAVVLVVSTLGAVAAPVAASHQNEGCSFPVTETDASGTEVTLEDPPEEIVVTDAASAQTVWEIGAEARITGMPVRSYTEYLEGSESRTDVLTDDGTGIETETVIELDPDLVITANPQFHSNESIQQLREAGLTVYQYPFEKSLDDIYEKTETYGHLLGECQAAQATVEDTRAKVETGEDTVADADEPLVLYYSFQFTAGEGTFINDLVVTAGGENLAASEGIQGFKQISDETIAERDPEWIVTTDTEGSIDTEREPFASTTAVQNDQVLEVDADLVSQAGPRVVEPLLAMAEAFHPEAFAEATATPTPTATPTDIDTATAESTATATDEPADGDGAGFGVAATVLALLSVALLARRR